MSIQKAKFSIGDIVKHKHFDFRGVIYDVDFDWDDLPDEPSIFRGFPIIIPLILLSFIIIKINFL